MFLTNKKIVEWVDAEPWSQEEHFISRDQRNRCFRHERKNGRKRNWVAVQIFGLQSPEVSTKSAHFHLND